MRLVVLGGLLALAGCGGGGTTGTNYSDPPPMADIVGTPTPRPSATPTPEAAVVENETAVENAAEVENAAVAEAPDNAAE